MTIKSQTLRISDIGGGLNTLNSSTDIDNKQQSVMLNCVNEGNKIIGIPGYDSLFTVGSTTKRGLGISLYGEYLFVIQDGKIYSYKDNIQKTSFDLTLTDDGSNVARNGYNITTFYLDTLYLVITDSSGVDDCIALKYNTSTDTFSTQAFTGVSNYKFTCSGFYLGKLLLGGNPSNPSGLFLSRAASVTNPGYAFDFTGTGSGSQIVGDGAPITGFIERQNTYYIVKRNSVWKVNNVLDTESTTTSPTIFNITQETATGAINQQSITKVMQDIFYYDGNSIRRLSYESNTLALSDVDISKQISPTLLALPKNQLQATSTFIYPYYKLFLRDINSLYNNIAFVYNVVNTSWSIQIGISPSKCTYGYINSNVGYFVSNYNGVVYQDNIGTTYDGNNIYGRFRSKAFAFGDEVDFKRLYQTEIYGKISPNFSLSLSILSDGKTIKTNIIDGGGFYGETTGGATAGVATAGGIGINAPSKKDFKERIETFNDGREFEIDGEFNGIGSFEIHGYNFQYNFQRSYPNH